MAHSELTCREMVELVTDYLEQTLPDAERARFDEHIGRCTGCRAYLDQMRRIIAEAGTLREDDLSEPARSSLLNAFRDWKRSG